MLGTFHDVALSGCSWMKYLPPSACSRYKLATKSRCTIEAILALFAASLSFDFAVFSDCHVEKSLHAGDPISIYGFCCRTMRLAL